MLSYRHAFHAGNHADVIKHLTLVLTLEYYLRKDKPFWYIDTHSGRGSYPLNSKEAQKNREFHEGIQPLWKLAGNADTPAEATLFLELIRSHNRVGKLANYPGSPWLAAQLLRPTDHLGLFELHPTDYEALTRLLGEDKRCKINKQDGLQGLLKLLPPPPRRAVTLIDPSYEIKSDYTSVINTLAQAHRRFATGTYLLWYPVVERQRIQRMTQALQATGITDILQIEFCPLPDNYQNGMTGSGLFVLNPPWILAEQMKPLLPWLNQHLANGRGRFTVAQIASETKR